MERSHFWQIFRGVCGGMVLFCVAFGLAPLPFIGTIHAGMVGLIVYGVLLGLLLVFWADWGGTLRKWSIWRRLRSVGVERPVVRLINRDKQLPQWWRRLRLIWACGLFAAALGGGILSVWMCGQAYFSPPIQGQQYTVVVLGCQIIGDQPSLMLRRRLDAAYRYLETQPEAPVVVSGGLDPLKSYSEAYVMGAYLTGRGIAPERVFLEEHSTTTATNLAQSARIILENGLPKAVAVATDGFHLPRGRLYAEKSGLRPTASLPATTPWGLLPSYWVREWFAICKAVILD